MRTQAGFTYLGLLLAIALLGLGLSAASEVWSAVAARQRLAQLDWIAEQYVQAIGSYYESTPGRTKAYPKTLEDMLEDRRFTFVRRHLRQVYVNPLTEASDWELLRAPDGGIRGLRFVSPVRLAGPVQPREFVYVPATR